MMSYEQFIEEAFIDPIRSVLMIDDDYPTYDEILGQREEQDRGTTSGKSWIQNPSSLRKLIRKFRERSRPLLVDIHDGTNVAAGDEQRLLNIFTRLTF